MSVMSRNILLCKIDDSVTKNTVDSIRKKKLSWDASVDECYFVGKDVTFRCETCKMDWFDDETLDVSTRPTHLHSLHHGCIRIAVQDNMCRCGVIVRYDRLTDGIFSASRYNLFTRELLDSWVFGVCGSGMKFRESFAVIIENEIIDQSPIVQCRMPSNAFSSYLKLLCFSSNDVLHKCFSCKSCWQEISGGRKRWEGIVMDGTSTGILKICQRFVGQL